MTEVQIREQVTNVGIGQYLIAKIAIVLTKKYLIPIKNIFVFQR